MKHHILFLFTLSLVACSSMSYRPVLYENKKYRKVGHMKAEADVNACLQKADRYLAQHKDERLSKNMKRGALQGAIIGGIFGTVAGKDLKGAATGTLGGAAVGAGGAVADEASKDSLQMDNFKTRYVSRCLQDKGYEIIGWK